MEQSNIEYAAQKVASLGRKVVDEDVMLDRRLQLGATDYVRQYTGESSFMTDIRSQLARRGLSIGQLRGALNVLRAQSAPQQEAETVAAPEDMAAVFELFATAGKVLKWPKVRLLTATNGVVVMSVAGPKSRYAGSVMVTGAGSFSDRDYYGRVEASGQFHRHKLCPVDVVDLLRRFASDPAGVAAEYGKLTGYCCFCQAELTDERSTGVGYGPVCAKNYGLPWGKKGVKVA